MDGPPKKTAAGGDGVMFSNPAVSSLFSVRSHCLTNYAKESNLVRWWRTLKQGGQLSTSDGRTVYLLEHGLPNIHDGPDISGVSLLIGSRLIRGDVEFHIHESDWFYHHHHEDPRYDDVILHVVAKCGNRRAVTSSGKQIDLVEISSDCFGFKREAMLCQLTRRCDETTILRFLQPLARIRWIRKVSRVRATIRETKDVQEAFYIQSFRSLGLKGNEQLFESLAKSIPFTLLSKLRNLDEILAMFLGAAGFLNSGFKIDAELSHYHHLWNDLSHQFKLEKTFPPKAWKRRGIRPKAFPERRMRLGAGIVWALLEGWQPWERSLEETLVDLNHIFTHTLPKKGWCIEWLGNVILPFQEAWDEFCLSGGSDERFLQWFILDLGYSYGQFSQQFSPYLKPKHLSNFGIQQGLLALLERYCELDLCRLCPLRR